MALNHTPLPAEAEPPEAAVRADVGELEDLLLEAVARLDEDSVRAPSALPGWSRGHVVAHLTNLATAFTRQAELAARGEVGEVYDGGPEGRDAGIEAAAPRSAEEHLAQLEAALVRLSASWPGEAAGWDAPVTYRSGTLRTILDAWWREVAIHAVDLDAGITAGAWSPALCDRLWEFLSERLPAGTAHVLETDEVGAGRTASHAPDTVRLVGARRDVLLWLAGRQPVVMPRALTGRGEVPLPMLGPWPGRSSAQPSR